MSRQRDQSSAEIVRAGTTGLTNEVGEVLRGDPLSGHVFVFVNRRRTMVKLLVWTRGGFTIVQKRLERGTFAFPSRVMSEARSIEIDVHELGMLLEGIDARLVRTSKRWEPPAHTRMDLGVAMR